jgi:hypothetical protein
MNHAPRALQVTRALALFALLASCSGKIGEGASDQPGPGPGSGKQPPSGGDETPGPVGGSGGGMMDPSHPPPPTDMPPPAGCGLPARRIWALTPDQFTRTVKTLLPGVAVSDGLATTLAQQDGFSNEAGRLDMTEPHVGQLLQTAWEVGAAAAADPAKLSPCLGQATVDVACVRAFVGDFATRAFRRDLAAAEIDALVTYFQKQQQAGDLRFAVQELMTAILTSPNFVYRTELGPENAAPGKPVTLTSFEKASALSYFLTDGPPDAALLAAARTQALETPAQIEAHARRLLASPQNAAGVLKMFHESFVLDEVSATVKDPKAFPAWKDQLANDLAGEADAFLKQVLWSEGGKLQTLLTADFSMLNGRLATFYGVGDPAAGEAFKKTPWRAGERAGLLTQAGHTATFAKENDTDVVGRGKFIREVLLCQPLPPPPPTVNAVPPPPDGKSTQRQRMATHSADPSCAGCHTLMDPLGLAFERYDGIGKYRTMDVGQALDTSGKLNGAEPEGAPFKDAVELMSVLAKSPTVRECFVATAFRYAQGRAPGSLDRCALDKLGTRFAGSGGDMIDLAVALVTDESFFQRAANP